MNDEVYIGSLFGYTTLVRSGDTFIALTGDGEPELRVGMQVTLLGDSRGYVPGGFLPGSEVTITGFVEPFKNGESDHIIEVRKESKNGRVKPSNIQRNVSVPTPSSPSDRRHQRMRQRVHIAFGDFLDSIYLALSEQERRSLPDDIGPYVNSLVEHALNRLSSFQHVLSEAIARVYAESPGGERFIGDPTRSNSISSAILFLDHDGEIVSVKNPDIVWDTSNPPALVLKRYESFEILTGPSSGKRFPWPTPVANPSVKSEAIPRTEPARGAALKPVRVFLCHSSGDKEAVRKLHSQLQADGLEPWLDEIDLVPGVEWRTAIKKAVREADVVLVCLSNSSISKTGYVQKEILFALDAAEERPEGQIYIVPARLEECPVPERLERWQWVDLFKSVGYSKLVKALTSPNPASRT